MATVSIPTYDTIIIGAGMSGLACASRLLDHQGKGKQILVLEARDRIGGRIAYVNVNGSRLDTGANWIHGIGTEDKPNPLVNVLPEKRWKELSSHVMFRAKKRRRSDGAGNFAKHDRRDCSDDDWTIVNPVESDRNSGAQSKQVNSNRSTWEVVSPKDLVVDPKTSSSIFGTVWGLIGALHERSATSSPEDLKSMSVLQAIMEDDDFKSAFEEIPERYLDTLRALPQFVENMEAGPLQLQSPSSGSTKPGLGMLEFAVEDFDGKQVFLRDGYTAVVEEVGSKVVKQGLVRLGVEVETIDYSGECIKVITRTSDVFYARRVVCTLPLGVLQHRLQKHYVTDSTSCTKPLFHPPLPEDKQIAISSLGFGTLDKIFLVYSHPWWTNEPFSTILKKGLTHHHFSDDTATKLIREDSEPDTLWGTTTLLPGLSISPGTIKDGPRALSIMNLHALTGVPGLSAFVSCQNAHDIEPRTDAVAGAIVTSTLKDWFGMEVPKPAAVHVTRWHQDPYSRGSYSHMITGMSEIEHREEFSRSITIRSEGCEVRFAGEHTSRDSFATVHGALLSGWREADAILKADG